MAGREWNTEETNFIVDHYDEMSTPAMAQELDRSVNSVANRIARLARDGRIILTKRVMWTAKDDQFLRDHTSMSISEQARQLQRSETSVRLRRLELGITSRQHRWSEHDEQVLARMVADGSKDADIAEVLKCSIAQVRRHRRSRGISHGTVRHWSDHDVEKLTAMYRCGQTYESMAQSLGRSLPSISNKCAALGLTTRSGT